MRFGKMFILAASAAATVGLAAPAAKAFSVTYTTTGVLAGTTQGITFAGVTADTVDATTFIDLGEFDTHNASSGVVNATFTLSVASTPPGGGGMAFGGSTITGSIIGSTSSSVVVTFSSPLSVVFPGTSTSPMLTYTILSPTLNLVAPNSGSNPGVTTIEGQVVAAPVPAAAWTGGASLLCPRRDGRNSPSHSPCLIWTLLKRKRAATSLPVFLFAKNPLSRYWRACLVGAACVQFILFRTLPFSILGEGAPRTPANHHYYVRGQALKSPCLGNLQYRNDTEGVH